MPPELVYTLQFLRFQADTREKNRGAGCESPDGLVVVANVNESFPSFFFCRRSIAREYCHNIVCVRYLVLSYI